MNHLAEQLLPSIPAVLIEPIDRQLSREDRRRMATLDSSHSDPVQDYYGHAAVQLTLLAEEHAAHRLQANKPHIYGALTASEQIKDIVRETPLIDGAALVPNARAKIKLKLENEQITGSFKLRGAAYAISQLTDNQLRKGVVTSSAGNHAWGVAYAAALIDTPATIFMSSLASAAKVAGIKNLGAIVIQVGNSFDEARLACEAMMREHPELTLIHPFNDHNVIIGQSSIFAEILEQNPVFDRVFLPIGGGGLIARNAAMIKEFDSSIKTIGVQLIGSEAARHSKVAGEIVRITSANQFSDGTAVLSPGAIPFVDIQRDVDEIIVVSDTDVAEAVVTYHQQYGRPIEAAGALALAGMRAMAAELDSGTAIGLVSGGNITDEALRHCYDLARIAYAQAA